MEDPGVYPKFLEERIERSSEPEIPEEYPLVREENINGMQLNLLGVSHTQDFFKEHEGFFKEHIRNAPAIFCEGTPHLNHPFISEVNNVAREGPTPIYNPDPQREYYLKLEGIQILIGGATANFSLLGLGLPTNGFSRRKFLKKGATGLLGLYLMASSAVFNQSEQVPEFDESTKFDVMFQYNTIFDYRNIVAAENLDRVSRKVDFDGPVPYIIGGRHLGGIHTYLNSPWLRKKRMMYLPQDFLIDPTMKKYEYRGGNWELTDKI